MKINSLQINNLRNHIHTGLEFNPGLNIFSGLNGAGKTTILEAVSICGFSRSFLPVQDMALIRKGEKFYSAGAECRSDLDIPYKVKIIYEFRKRKKISSGLGDNLNPKDIIGSIPLVILSPDYKAITFGAPVDRRQFIDRLLSQAGRRYIDEFIKMKRTLRQRNSLLNNAKTERYFDRSLLEPWNEQFINTSAEIVIRRHRFIKDFLPVFLDVYRNVSDGKEDVSMVYEPDNIPQEILASDLKKEDIVDRYRILLKEKSEDEYRRGTTAFGPQKDELRIGINGGTAKEIASQGQHKTLLISIKFAEFNFLMQKRNETPVVLLDDIFSELDKKRAAKVLELVAGRSAQTFITLTDSSIMKEIIETDKNSAYFNVENGIVSAQN